jgi:hypothetical protein
MCNLVAQGQEIPKEELSIKSRKVWPGGNRRTNHAVLEMICAEMFLDYVAEKVS